MRFPLLLFCFCLLLTPLAAQKNFWPGYIILQDNDTLHGSISVRSGKLNPEKISFIPDAGEKPSAYGPNDIRAFFFEKNDRYHFYETHFLKTTLTSRPASSGSDSTSAFLYVYLKDEPLSLYYFQGNSSYFFIQQNDGPLTLLPNPNKDSEGGRSLPMEKYKRHLFYYLADWPDASQQINYTRYNDQHLLRLIRDYNYYKQGGQQPAYMQTTPSSNVQIGIFAGTTLSRIEFNSEQQTFNYLTEGSARSSLSPALGIFFNLPLLNLLPELTLYNELGYRSYNIEIDHTDHELYWKPRIVTNLDIAYIRPSHMFRWTVLNAPLQPFVQAGIWYAASIKRETTSVTQRYSRLSESYQNFETRNTFDEQGFKPFEVGLGVGAGISVRKLSAELRYDYGNGMSDFVSLSAVTHSAGLLLTYRFL